MLDKDKLIWAKNREYVEYFLNKHKFPKNEIDRILTGYDNSLKNEDAYDMIRCIDFSLGWASSTYHYDFYYFSQLRLAYYMCFYAPHSDQKKAYAYLGDLIHGYGSKPFWKGWGNDGHLKFKADKLKGDLVLSEEEFDNRKKFFRNKIKELSEKFGK